MRYDHPQIGSYVEGRTVIYDTPSAEAVDNSLATTFLVAHSTTVAELNERLRPFPLSTIHYLPGSSQIVIVASHWQIDGIGALELLNNLMKALAWPRHIKFGTETKNLSPSLDEAANMPINPTDEDEDEAAKLLLQYTGNLPSVGLPANFTNPLPGATRRVVHELSWVATTEIVEACKRNKFSVTTALHSALILATKQMDPRSPQPQYYTSWASFTLRPYLSEPYSIPFKYPVSAFMVGLPVSVEPSTFKEHASQLQPFYRQFSSSSRSKAALPSYLKSYIRQAAELFTTPPAGENMMPTEPVLDSIGLCDRYLSRFYGDTVELINFSLASETLTAQLTTYVWTWQGRMTLSVCYNERFYMEKVVVEFIQRLLRTLFQELELESVTNASSDLKDPV